MTFRATSSSGPSTISPPQQSYVKDADFQLAVKPIGLTGGKGVKVQGEQLRDKEEVLAYVREIFDSGIGGAGVVLEEKTRRRGVHAAGLLDGGRVSPCRWSRTTSGRSKATSGRTPGAWARTRCRTICCRSSREDGLEHGDGDA